jgi:TRAP-type uncharacterized transport system substrate-binding protein
MLKRALTLPLLALLSTLLVIAGAWWIVEILRPLPPLAVAMATGPAGSYYAEIAARYREILARSGIHVGLIPTVGSMDSLQRMRDPRGHVSIAFVPSGMTTPVESPTLASLGAVSFEPLWIFSRVMVNGVGASAFRGKRVSIGQVGSGTRVLALKLLTLEGMREKDMELLGLRPEEAEAKLVAGEIDAAVILSAWDSPVIRRLLANPDVHLLGVPRADAYLALVPTLQKVVLPSGVGDLARNLPPTNVTLLGLDANLLVRGDLHPAIQYLLLEAAEQIHGGPGIFNKAGEFPAPRESDLPLTSEARQYYKSGQPFLQRYLPFWLAVLVEQFLVLLIPLAGVIYPLARLIPSLVGWQARNRILKFYGELKLVETEIETHPTGKARDELIARLDLLEDRANHLKVPNFTMQSLYTLKVHIRLVRERLEKQA